MSTLLEIRNIFTGYDEADVLSGVSIKIKKGQITCLLGANGSGKTTLIRTILALTQSRSGQIFFDGQEITEKETHDIVRLGISTIPEGRKVFPKLTVKENLLIGAILEKNSIKLSSRFEEVIDIFPQLRNRRNQIAGTMSGGEQAMLSIGRGLMGAPKLLVIDEPSLGLSPLFVKENFKVIHAIKERGITVLLVEQNVKQTLEIADYGYVLSQGHVVADGTAEALANSDQVQSAYFGIQKNKDFEE